MSEQPDIVPLWDSIGTVVFLVRHSSRIFFCYSRAFSFFFKFGTRIGPALRPPVWGTWCRPVTGRRYFSKVPFVSISFVDVGR